MNGLWSALSNSHDDSSMYLFGKCRTLGAAGKHTERRKDLPAMTSRGFALLFHARIAGPLAAPVWLLTARPIT